jgi:hypothetical protein
MNREMPGNPKMMFPSVDVRDSAKAHILALTKPGINGRRILIN